jgi:hypothetical protein
MEDERKGMEQIFGGIFTSRFALLDNTNMSNVKRNTKASNGNLARVSIFEKRLTS